MLQTVADSNIRSIPRCLLQIRRPETAAEMLFCSQLQPRPIECWRTKRITEDIFLHIRDKIYRQYKTHQITTLKRFSHCLAVFFAESLEARCQVENEDVVGAAPTGDAPTTSEWSTLLLPSQVRLVLEVLRYLVSGYLDLSLSGYLIC